MVRITDIRVQKLFVTVLFLKILSSGLSLYFGAPWSLGFAIPLCLMVAYILIGLKRSDDDVTDEKFADTCYYLGFIFTITSIIFALFDLPNIGTKITEIAVRFGAAMVSTVLGLGVRVYLVSFKKDVADAIRDAEDAVLDANRKFTEQLTIALEKLRGFETQVDDAAKATVERVNLQVEALSKNHADKLTVFFADLTNRNQSAFTEAMSQIKVVSKRLSDSVDGYTEVMRTNITSIELKVNSFAEAISNRLKETSFPDDYFVKHLEPPLKQLKDSAAVLASDVQSVSSEVGKSSKALTLALNKLNGKSEATGDVLGSVSKLVEQQKAAIQLAEGQVSALEQVTTMLGKFDLTLTNTLSGIESTRSVNEVLGQRISELVAQGNNSTLVHESSFAMVAEKLDLSVTASRAVSERLEANSNAATLASLKLGGKLDAGIEATKAVTEKLGAAASATEMLASKLNSVVENDGQVVNLLKTIDGHGTEVVSRIDEAVSQLHRVVSQFAGMDVAFRSQQTEVQRVSEGIQEMKVMVASGLDRYLTEKTPSLFDGASAMPELEASKSLGQDAEVTLGTAEPIASLPAVS